MAYDVMKDVVVKAGIRDRMISDMRDALEALADWPTGRHTPQSTNTATTWRARRNLLLLPSSTSKRNGVNSNHKAAHNGQ